MKAISWLLAVLLMLGLLSVSVPATSAGCFSLVSDLQRNWIEVRRYLLPLGASFENNPSNEQFVCVSNYAVRHALERKAGTTSNIRCFSPSEDKLGFCCDGALRECAGLNPGLFPDHFDNRKKNQEQDYKAPESGWVRPPADGDQWKSN